MRWLLLPISLLYGLALLFRNKLYDWGVLSSARFDVPTISVGNLSVGGTGKTPHIEYLVRLLSQDFKPATLSRGYKRKTTGFLLASLDSSAEEIGDEPRIFKQKFPYLPVAVCASRALGIPNILTYHADVDVILLDDAFQHRSVDVGLNILLTEYHKLYLDDFLLPIGNLREYKSAAKRADFIVVTKCPKNLTSQEIKEKEARFKLEKGQQLFFSEFHYHQPYNFLNNTFRIQLDKSLDVVVLCAIANPDQLETYLENEVANVYMVEYADHYFFLEQDLEALIEKYHEVENPNKIILTTEKDATRLERFIPWFRKRGIDIFCLPIEVYIRPEDRLRFNNAIMANLEKQKTISNESATEN